MHVLVIKRSNPCTIRNEFSSSHISWFTPEVDIYCKNPDLSNLQKRFGATVVDQLHKNRSPTLNLHNPPTDSSFANLNNWKCLIGRRGVTHMWSRRYSDYKTRLDRLDARRKKTLSFRRLKVCPYVIRINETLEICYQRHRMSAHEFLRNWNTKWMMQDSKCDRFVVQIFSFDPTLAKKCRDRTLSRQDNDRNF